VTSDEIVISAPGLDGTRGRLAVQFGWRARHYGSHPFPYYQIQEIGLGIQSLDEAGNRLDGTGRTLNLLHYQLDLFQKEIVGIHDAELDFVFGEKIGIGMNVRLDASGIWSVVPPATSGGTPYVSRADKVGGYAMASWRGIQEVRDAAGNLVPFTFGGGNLMRAGAASSPVATVTSLSGFDYTIASEEPEIRMIPEPASLSLLAFGGLTLLRRRR
jgi:hypothetical protein